MMNDLFMTLFLREWDRRTYKVAPFEHERRIYLEHQWSLGFKKKTVQQHAWYQLIILGYFSQQIKEHQPITKDEIIMARDDWSKKRHSNGFAQVTIKVERGSFVHVAKQWLEYIGLYRETEDVFYCSDILSEYLQWIVSVRGTPRRAKDGQFYILRRLLKYLGERNISINDAKPIDIDSYLLFKSSEGCKRNSIASIIYVVRSFFRYLEERGICKNNISNAIRGPRIYKEETIPSFLPWESIQHMLNTYPRETPIQIRNYAILLLYAIYGLRCSEALNLKLKDIDWRNETIFLARSKDSKPQLMPLVPLIGDAIVDYLQNVRPNETKEPEIFLSMRAPFCKLTSSVGYQIAHQAITKEDVTIKHRGPHALRHSVATHLVNTGHPMKEVADMLGHQTLDTTRIYAKVDFTNLKKVANMNWEEIL